MGCEYRLYINPPLDDFEETCRTIIESGKWIQIKASFTEVAGIGVVSKDSLKDASWPHIAELHDEENGSIYLAYYSVEGRRFMDAFVEDLRVTGRKVDIEEL